MGFLDRAKKLADQAKEVKGKAEELRDRIQASQPSGGSRPSAPSGPTAPQDPRFGTHYVPGMLGRTGWRERGLEDPAAVLPISDRDRCGISHTTKSQIIEEPFGMGRRWDAGLRSAALLYRLYPEHQAWQPPGDTAPLPEVPGASLASLEDGRDLVFLGAGDHHVVLEVRGLDDSARAELVRAVANRLPAG
jgi:hypothetical protein